MPTLTDEQRRQWAVDGYIHLEGALAPQEVSLYCGLIDALRPQAGWEPVPGLPFGHYAWVERNATADDLESFMDRRDILGYAEPFRDLIDRPNVFDPILELMGPYIVLSMSQPKLALFPVAQCRSAHILRTEVPHIGVAPR